MNLNNPSMHYRVHNEYYKFLDQQSQLVQGREKSKSNMQQQLSSKVKQMTSKSNQTVEDQQVFSDYELPPASNSMIKHTFNHFLNYQKRIPAQPMFKSTYIPKLDSRIHSSGTWRSKLNDKQQNYQKIPYKGKFFLSPNRNDSEKTNQLQVTNSKREQLFSREQIKYLQKDKEDEVHNIKSTKSEGKKKFQIVSYTKNLQVKTQSANDDDDISETEVVVFTSKKRI